MTYELWRFDTERFSVVCTAEEEHYVDLSWDETGETLENLQSGLWQVFCAKVAVYLDGREIAADYLGQCIYENPEDFVTGDHRNGYFRDMVSVAIREARDALRDVPRIRKVA